MKLTEIYIDNYKCLSNFRIKPGDFQLWLGDNGSGKSSVIQLLECVQDVLSGHNIADVFSENCKTEWDKRNNQWVQITAEHEGNNYVYQLTIGHLEKPHTRRISIEVLIRDGQTQFIYDGRDAEFNYLHQQTGEIDDTLTFPSDGRRSAIPDIADREELQHIVSYREAVKKWLLINPIPHLVGDLAISEDGYLSFHGDNFANWYRYIVQEEPRVTFKVSEQLAKVLPGFELIRLREAGTSRQLVVSFRIAGESRVFELAQLSDGQVQLIILYTLLEALRAGVITTLFIDEPDNFVSLREIQPWLAELRDVCEEEDRQAIIISHHPEIINKMARGEELWFSREEGAHVVVKPLPVTDGGLTPAEIVTRGWEK